MRQVETFHIGRFRGLTDITLDGTSQFNLVVGGNNSGKTSVLEALTVYAAPADVAEWASVARAREVSASAPGSAGLSTPDAVRWLFHQETPGVEGAPSYLFLAAQGRANVRSLEARCDPIRGIPPEPRFKAYPYRGRTRSADVGDVEEDGWNLSIHAKLDRPLSRSLQNQLPLEVNPGEVVQDPTELSLALQLWSTVPLVRSMRRRGPRIRAESLSPYSHRNQPLQVRSLSDTISSGRKEAVLSLLRGVDPELADLEIIASSDDRPLLVALFGRGRRVPVTVLGDGFRRALAIALALDRAEGGMLLIDEIEAAMHVSALETLFPWLLRSAIEKDVQVFATTHSLEAIQHITSAVSRADSETLTAFQLPSRASTSPTLKRYTGGMLKRLVQDRGLDIR